MTRHRSVCPLSGAGPHAGELARLGALFAQPYVETTGHAGIGRRHRAPPVASPRRAVQVLVGDADGRALLMDRPGEGAVVVDVTHANLRLIDVPGGLVLHEVEPDGRRRRRPSARTTRPSPGAGAPTSDASRWRWRSSAPPSRPSRCRWSHAGDRRQFGTPIGTFQAIRHLLAWARTDCVAVEHVIAEAVALDDAAPPMFDGVVKALAGRNGRRACERARCRRHRLHRRARPPPVPQPRARARCAARHVRRGSRTTSDGAHQIASPQRYSPLNPSQVDVSFRTEGGRQQGAIPLPGGVAPPPRGTPLNVTSVMLGRFSSGRGGSIVVIQRRVSAGSMTSSISRWLAMLTALPCSYIRSTMSRNTPLALVRIVDGLELPPLAEPHRALRGSSRRTPRSATPRRTPAP